MRFLRLGICGLVAFTVVAHGGVENWARAVLEAGAGLLFFIWALRFYFHGKDNDKNSVVFSPLLPPLAGFFLMVIGQWLFHTTASPLHTRIEGMLLLAYLILLFLAAQAFRSLEDWRSFVWFGMWLGFLVSVFGILQHLTFNGKLYWFRELHYSGFPFGPYANRNHFAGLMELLLPLSLVPLVLGRVRRERWVVVGLFAILPVAALFLSASRGGIVSFAAQLALLALVMIRNGAIRGKHLLAGGMVLLLALTIVSWLGVGRILQRFSSLQLLEVNEGKRASMRHDTWHIFLDHPFVGTGLGTLQIVYPRYETLYDGKIVNHTHNDYLEAVAETGMLGGFCCAWFLAALISQFLLRQSQLFDSFVGALQLSAMVACAGILVHALVDFNFHIPSNLLLFFLMAYLATAPIQQVPSQATRRKPHSSPRNS